MAARRRARRRRGHSPRGTLQEAMPWSREPPASAPDAVAIPAERDRAAAAAPDTTAGLARRRWRQNPRRQRSISVTSPPRPHNRIRLKCKEPTSSTMLKCCSPPELLPASHLQIHTVITLPQSRHCPGRVSKAISTPRASQAGPPRGHGCQIKCLLHRATSDVCPPPTSPTSHLPGGHVRWGQQESRTARMGQEDHITNIVINLTAL